MRSVNFHLAANWAFAGALAILTAVPPLLAQSGPHVYQLKLAGVSAPLREAPPSAAEAPAAHQVVLPPPESTRRAATTGEKETVFADSAVQRSTGPLVGTTNLANFDGISADGITPPDSNGSVGATQFFEIVNTEYAVYDKTTGTQLLAPRHIHTVWSSIGGLCGTQDHGDPIVLYDKSANRWLVSQLESKAHFADNQVCIALSTTPDATGSYYLYVMDFGTNLPDYPKFGVWPDGYYLSVNLFSSETTFVAPEVCAFDRNSMLVGGAATAVCFQASSSDSSFLPSDLDGATPPSSGEPNFYLELFTDKNNTARTGSALHLFQFHVDFNTPGNSTFTGPVAISVSPYNLACQGGVGVCVAQISTTQKLEALGDRLMYRLAYRNFGSYEALVVNHTVALSSKTSQTGTRWYEIRNPGGTPSVFQQSTFAPDTSYRWMGSMAEDKAGNLVLGYSVSSSTMNPAIRFTSRVPTDPINTMEAEATIFSGTGSQTGGGRWGDYTSMSIDPADDCTFWYTNEYLLTNGKFNWRTRIASFKFPSCQ